MSSVVLSNYSQYLPQSLHKAFGVSKTGTGLEEELVVCRKMIEDVNSMYKVMFRSSGLNCYNRRSYFNVHYLINYNSAPIA